ncbi:hypothetical protein HPP92_014457 [Vanilla planifolia]|uniref:Uncharacterized protein n=1 Tax=Vanilla planifolia TaxID=51239 RepID=A0A835QK19_VANPL|nr:hypothetical protein HPP92_014457 [Vanilla planifolia]
MEELETIMKSEPEVLKNISRTLRNPHASLNLVVYGLGSLEAMYSSQYGLTFMLLLKRPLELPIGAIDHQVWHQSLLSGRRVVEKPTIFFVPRLPFSLVGYTFEANLSATQLNKLFFLGAAHFDKRETIRNERFERMETYYLVSTIWSLKKLLFTGKYVSFCSLPNATGKALDYTAKDRITPVETVKELFYSSEITNQPKSCIKQKIVAYLHHKRQTDKQLLQAVQTEKKFKVEQLYRYIYAAPES